MPSSSSTSSSSSSSSSSLCLSSSIFTSSPSSDVSSSYHEESWSTLPLPIGGHREECNGLQKSSSKRGGVPSTLSVSAESLCSTRSSSSSAARDAARAENRRLLDLSIAKIQGPNQPLRRHLLVYNAVKVIQHELDSLDEEDLYAVLTMEQPGEADEATADDAWLTPVGKDAFHAWTGEVPSEDDHQDNDWWSCLKKTDVGASEGVIDLHHLKSSYDDDATSDDGSLLSASSSILSSSASSALSSPWSYDDDWAAQLSAWEQATSLNDCTITGRDMFTLVSLQA